MAAKKKIKKKQARTQKTTGKNKKMKPAKKLARRKITPKKKLAKKAAKKTVAAKSSATRKKAIANKPASAPKKHAPKKTPIDNIVLFNRETSRARSGGQSGDLQGLSNIEQANSESVDELLEEGNAFEAEVVAGVEDAGNADEEEVHTHEVPEDDVPDEYLDKD